MSVEVIEKEDTKVTIQRPKMYSVVFHNDESTSFQYVIGLLMAIFGKSIDDAIRLTEDIHFNGKGVAGVYTKEIADEKKYECDIISAAEKCSLLVTCEPNDDEE